MQQVHSLSRFERLMLINQFKIMKVMGIEYESECDEIIEILERGYTLEYGNAIFRNIDEELTIDECKRVIDILNMFVSLQRAVRNLSDEDEDKVSLKSASAFPGFDGNNESDQLSYCNFLIEEQSGFKELARGRTDTCDGFDRWNSHRPTREMYDRMLRVWKQLPFKRRRELSKEDLKAIIEAQPFPE